MNLEPQERKALVLVGAGSAVFTRGLLADLISAPDLGPWDLRLVDTNPEALRVTVALAEKMVAARSEGERIRVRGTEQTIAVSIRIISSSTVGFKTNSIKAPFGNPVVCRVQPSIEISVIRLVMAGCL